jgi:hypothetical protein
MNHLALNRHIVISKLLRSSEKTEFFEKHTLVYGIFNDSGLEYMKTCKDWDTLEGITKLNSRISRNELRTRLNPHRNTFIMWLPNEVLKEVEKIIANEDFIEAKRIIISLPHLNI